MTHTQDPIQGLIDYVNEIKPFHTKILEVAVAYAQSEDIDVVFTEEFNLDVSLFYPALADDDDVPIRVCPEGWGVIWDRPSPYIVVNASISPQTISLDGDQSAFFAIGTRFEVREPINEIPGSPVPPTPRVFEYRTLSVTYNATTDTTILGVTETRFDYLGSPIIFGSPTLGSPFFGSSPISGLEFFFPPYPAGSISNGDVFIIYPVISTSVLEIRTRPSPFYGGPGSPGVAGSPLPGSPKLVTGSPATLSTFGSPNNPGNKIVIKSVTAATFLYGREIEIRNATETTINKTYNVHTAIDLGGSPELVELLVLDPILANTTNDGELVFTPNGWSGGSFCSDVPPEYGQTHWMEQFDQTWRFADGSPLLPLTSNFQHFILAADSTNNTFTVEGDVRDLLGSPITPVAATVQHGVAPPYDPFELRIGSPVPLGSPLTADVTMFQVTLNANNGNVVISSITYDLATDRSLIFVDSVTDDFPTGWIINR